MPADSPSPRRVEEGLGDPAVRRYLEEFVRRRVPAADVEDVVQTVLVEALASTSQPTTELRPWLLGIARHKVADMHRKASRERPEEMPEIEAPPAPIEAHSLARWAQKQLGASPDAQQTLDWMAREGEGDKLERIAAEEDVPAPRVRQRVSRTRRWMKERWLAEIALVAALGVVAFVLYRWLRRPNELPIAVPEPQPTESSITPEPPPLERARALRAEAFERCDASDWRACLDDLDRAKQLDPAGDDAPEVVRARQRAEDALAPAPLNSAEPPTKSIEPGPGPTTKAPPKTAPKQKAPTKAKPPTPFEQDMKQDFEKSLLNQTQQTLEQEMDKKMAEKKKADAQKALPDSNSSPSPSTPSNAKPTFGKGSKQ